MIQTPFDGNLGKLANFPSDVSNRKWQSLWYRAVIRDYLGQSRAEEKQEVKK